MFKKLRNRIIIITMAVTTAVLVTAGTSIMFFTSAIRPEPKFRVELFTSETDNTGFNSTDINNDKELKEFIRIDRKEGNIRLLTTLLGVGLIVEAVVFIVTYYLSKQIVEPVKDAYDKQKLFIANASHELKTPLAVIQANMEALDVDKNNEKWKNNIESEITHANKLVLSLLQLAKMDAGEAGEKNLERVELAEEIKKRIEIFQPKFDGKIKFENKTRESEKLLPKQDVLQVLDILLDNATKYGDKKINIELEQGTITISNDGSVVPKADTEKIFDRFYQTDKTREGSGLGLAIAKAICEQNKWVISCQSEKKMTKFKIIF